MLDHVYMEDLGSTKYYAPEEGPNVHNTLLKHRQSGVYTCDMG